MRRPFKVAYSAILLSAACSLPLDPAAERLAVPFTPNALTAAAADSALRCGIRSGLMPVRRPEWINLYTVPLESFSFGPHTVAGAERGSTIYLADRLAGFLIPWAHGFAHVIFDLGGFTDRDASGRLIAETHPRVFFECGLMP